MFEELQGSEGQTSLSGLLHSTSIGIPFISAIAVRFWNSSIIVVGLHSGAVSAEFSIHDRVFPHRLSNRPTDA